jgi:hypothetical protein
MRRMEVDGDIEQIVVQATSPIPEPCTEEALMHGLLARRRTSIGLNVLA